MEKSDYIQQLTEKVYTTDSWFDTMKRAVIWTDNDTNPYPSELVYRYLKNETKKLQNALRIEETEALERLINNHKI